MAHAADQRTGDYSLGMRQRLAVATALLGSPPVLILDEPANGLDPEGIAWLRELLREHARAGGTVLISSHLLAELAQLIDDVVIIAKGRVRCAAPLAELYGGTTRRLRIRGGDPRRLWQAFERAGARVSSDGHALEVWGLSPEHAGEIVFVEGLLGRLSAPLPFSAFLGAGGGDRTSLLIAAAWTALALAGAVLAIRRDLTAD
ncbi:AAA family ATPase [Plantactinospora mayteni]|uniref:AAA family ATPase n=1 Tax=Plantactinospora mayteni TaxID=566021 RepID=UPI0023B3292E